MLGLTMFITPAAMVCGLSFMIFRRYMPQHYIGWTFMTAGCGILAVLNINSNKATIISTPIMLGMSIGMGWTMTKFPILAPLPYSNNAHALAFFTFLRNLSQVRSCPTFLMGKVIKSSSRPLVSPSVVQSSRTYSPPDYRRPS
jgi:hypothetical protein